MKKILVCIIFIIVIIGVIFGIKKVNNSKINYEIAKVESFEFVEYYENGKYGVLNKDGEVLIEANYKKVVIPNPEKDLFICYDENDNTKVLNSQGNILLTEFDKVEPIKLKNIASVLCYEKSVLIYKKDGLLGLIDFDGKEITKNIYNSIENLQLTEGKLIVSKNNKYGIININGKTLVKTEYDSIKTDGYYDENTRYVYAGFIVSNTTNDGYRYGYIDYKGKKILDVKYNELSRIEDLKDIYLIVAENGKYGLYKESKQRLKLEYQLVEYDNDSKLVLLQKNKKYGISDLNGKIKIELMYTDIDLRGIYIYASNENENTVYDFNGIKQNISFNKSIYETENEKYMISTITNNNITYYGIENKQGNKLVNENYSYIEYAYKDYFIARDQNGQMGIINSNGKVLVDFKYSFIQKLKGKNIIQVLDDKNKKTYLFSPDLEKIYEIKDASIDNQDKFIRIYNSKKEVYFDNLGNEISKDSELIKNIKSDILPNEIGQYVKVQYSLDNAYYVKK